jgi:hypothetical protein
MSVTLTQSYDVKRDQEKWIKTFLGPYLLCYFSKDPNKIIHMKMEKLHFVFFPIYYLPYFF